MKESPIATDVASMSSNAQSIQIRDIRLHASPQVYLSENDLTDSFGQNSGALRSLPRHLRLEGRKFFHRGKIATDTPQRKDPAQGGASLRVENVAPARSKCPPKRYRGLPASSTADGAVWRRSKLGKWLPTYSAVWPAAERKAPSASASAPSPDTVSNRGQWVAVDGAPGRSSGSSRTRGRAFQRVRSPHLPKVALVNPDIRLPHEQRIGLPSRGPAFR
jgi:hypothetical protein